MSRRRLRSPHRGTQRIKEATERVRQIADQRIQFVRGERPVRVHLFPEALARQIGEMTGNVAVLSGLHWWRRRFRLRNPPLRSFKPDILCNQKTSGLVFE